LADEISHWEASGVLQRVDLSPRSFGLGYPTVNFTLLRRNALALVNNLPMPRCSVFAAETDLKILELRAEKGSTGRSPCGREVCIAACRMDPMLQR
jgi:hypothetical protein